MEPQKTLHYRFIPCFCKTIYSNRIKWPRDLRFDVEIGALVLQECPAPRSSLHYVFMPMPFFNKYKLNNDNTTIKQPVMMNANLISTSVTPINP